MDVDVNYDTLHGSKLRAICVERGLDVSGCKGKESYLKLLRDSRNIIKNMDGTECLTYSIEGTKLPEPTIQELPTNPTIITQATLEDLKSVGISKTKILIDKIKSDLDSLVWRGKKGERRFNDGRYYYHIDPNENTIHFLGGCLGPICQTLSCPDGFVTKMGMRYLMASTVAGKDGMVAEVN